MAFRRASVGLVVIALGACGRTLLGGESDGGAASGPGPGDTSDAGSTSVGTSVGSSTTTGGPTSTTSTTSTTTGPSGEDTGCLDGCVGPDFGGVAPPDFGGGSDPGLDYGIVTFAGMSALLAADFSGDGIGDVVSVLPDPMGLFTVTTYRGDGTARAFLEPLYATITAWGTDPRIFDVEGDGDLDIVGVTQGRGASPSRLHVLVNDGGGVFNVSQHTDFPETPFVHWRGELALGDLTGDANADLVIGQGHSSGALVLYGDGLGGFAYGPVIPQPACYFAGMVIADVDFDGTAELFAGGGCNAPPDRIPLWRYWFDAPSKQILVDDRTWTLGTAASEISPLVALDIDLDGLQDLVRSDAGALVVRRTTGIAELGDEQQFLFDGPFDHLVVAELDGAPMPDVAAPSGDALALYWFSSLEGGSFMAPDGSFIGTADFDGDRLSDFAYAQPDGTLVLLVSRG